MFPLKWFSVQLELEVASVRFLHGLFVLDLLSTQQSPNTWFVLGCAVPVFGTEGDGCFWQMLKIKVALLSSYPQGVRFSDTGSGGVNRSFSLAPKRKLSAV